MSGWEFKCLCATDEIFESLGGPWQQKAVEEINATIRETELYIYLQETGHKLEDIVVVESQYPPGKFIGIKHKNETWENFNKKEIKNECKKN